MTRTEWDKLPEEMKNALIATLEVAAAAHKAGVLPDESIVFPCFTDEELLAEGFSQADQSPARWVRNGDTELTFQQHGKARLVVYDRNALGRGRSVPIGAADAETLPQLRNLIRTRP